MPEREVAQTTQGHSDAAGYPKGFQKKRSARWRVLLVDDNPSLRALYKGQLIEEGYEVEALESGEKTIERLERGPAPDALVLDIKLGGMDGIEVMRRVLAQRPKIPILLHSAYADFKDDFSAWCADDYVLKSPDRHALGRSLERMLRRRQLGEKKAP